jgi:hypothetical protein
MFPLVSHGPPGNRQELVEALNRGLGEVFDLPRGRRVVEAAGEGYPALEQLSFDVTGARLRPDFRPRFPGGLRQSGLKADTFRVLGDRVLVERSAIDFELNASGVHFDINHDEAQYYLDPVEAERGRFQSHVGLRDLEMLLLTAGDEEVSKHGLKIERVEASLRDETERSVHAEVRVTASTKMAFATLSAVIVGRGHLVIDDALNVTISGLTFEGEGLAGKMAAALAHQQLSQFEGWSIPLNSLPLGRLRLHDVRIACRHGLQVEATLGS